MSRTIIRFLSIISILVLSGCKLAVIVVEGGEVQSTGSGICIAGTICLIDVADTNFSETFTAVPNEGWYFRKWNQGDRLFCGNSYNQECVLTFEGLQAEKNVEVLVASDEVFYLMPVFKAYQDVIIVDGKQWLQPSLFDGVSWSDIKAVCPHEVCSGMLNGIDVSGWTWAALDDVKALFHYYIGSEVLESGENYFFELDSDWAPRFFSDGWAPYVETEYIVEGWTRSLYEDLNEPNNAYFLNIHYNPGSGDEYFDSIRILWTEFDSRAPEGAWFYRIP